MRIEYTSPLRAAISIVGLLTVFLTASSSAQEVSASQFYGYWAITGAGGATDYMLIKREGEVTAFDGGRESMDRGEWRLEGTGLHITWPNGNRDVLRATTEGYVRNRYLQGSSMQEEPSGVGRARRVSRREVGELQAGQPAGTVNLDPDILLEKLVGVWQVEDREGRPYFIEVKRWGRAARFTFNESFDRKIETRGTWTVLPNGLHVKWEDGNQDVIRASGGRLEKASFAEGASVMSVPAYKTPIIQSSYNDIDEVLAAAEESRIQSRLAQMAASASSQSGIQERLTQMAAIAQGEAGATAQEKAEELGNAAPTPEQRAREAAADSQPGQPQQEALAMAGIESVASSADAREAAVLKRAEEQRAIAEAQRKAQEQQRLREQELIIEQARLEQPAEASDYDAEASALQTEKQRLMRELAELDRQAVVLGLDTVSPVKSVAPEADLKSLPMKRPDSVNLVFQDNFDEAPDPAHWFAPEQVPFASAGANAEFKAGNASVVRGMLNLTAYQSSLRKKEGEARYYAALLSGTEKTAGGYGLYEFRLRVPEGRGLQATVALRDAGGRVHVNVLDVICQQPEKAHFFAKLDDGAAQSASYEGIDLSRGFHTVSVDCDAEGISFFIDYQLRARMDISLPELPLIPVMYMSVGTERSGEPDGWTPFPSSLVVDYVRFYKAD